MNIQIVGAGSVGLLVTSYLVELGHAVTLVCRNDEQRAALQANGLTRQNVDGTFYRCQMALSAELSKDAHLTIVTTKSYHLEPLFADLAKLPTHTSVMFMQNGLAHYEPALQLPQHHIVFASVQFGALKDSDCVVKHTGIGVFKVATAKGHGSQQLITSNLEHFPIQYVDDAFQMLFEKALLNSFINPLTAILQVKNGVLVKNDYAFQLIQQLYSEFEQAFTKEMANFSLNMVVSLCEKTAANHSSMLMDRIHQRKSEIDAIVLPLLKLSKSKGYQLPTLQSLYTIVKAIETECEQ